MKRYLNLNEPGSRMFLVGIFLGGIIPAVIWLVHQILDALGMEVAWLKTAMWVFFALGGAVLAVLLILVILEAIQDRILTRQILGNRKRIALENGMYECPFCGNREVREFERECPVCHKNLE